MAKNLVLTPNARLKLVNSDGSLTIPAMQMLQQMATAINGAVNSENVASVTLGNGVTVSAFAGTPNGLVVGSPGDQFSNLNGGAGQTFWVKESGVGTNTGWVAK